MSWLDTLSPASFRGVPFQVSTIDVQAGDNVVLREYPFQDLPTVFRMGDGVEEIKFSAYVIGDDYDQKRDALRAVLTGDGVLVHPTAGSMRVFVAGKYTIKEAPTAEGGMARFDLTFVRAETRRYPTAAANTGQQATQAAATAQAAAVDDFAAAWSLAGKPGWVADQAVQRIKDSVASTWSKISTVTAGATDFTNSAIANYQALAGGLDSLVSAPRQLGVAIVNLFNLPAELTDATAREFQSAFAWVFTLPSQLDRKPFETISMPAVGAGLVMYGTGNASAAPMGSAGQVQAAALAAASDRLIVSAAAAGYVQATAAVDLANYDEAMAMRSAIGDQLTAMLMQASTSGPAATLPASSWQVSTQALYTAAMTDLQSRSRDLVRLTTYTPQSWQPAIYISYRLFGTADYADEIVAMNPHIQHPLLVPPGIALRILKH